MADWIGPQDRVKVAKKHKITLTCDVTHREPQTQNEKNFFFKLTRRLTESSEGLNSSLSESPGKL